MIEFTDSERGSPLWVKIERFLAERLESARLQLEKGKIEDIATYRGQIREIRAFMSLGVEKPIIPLPPPEY